MGTDTFIEWADGTLGFAGGCTKVSSGCDNCYMYRMSPMYGRDPNIFKARRLENCIKDMSTLQKKQKNIIFVNSMTDTFHENASFELIKSWFDAMAKYKMQFLILTKRIKRAKDYFDGSGAK